jgi:hypothetical protein
MYGKATKVQWRTKQPPNKDESFQARRIGEVVSVDQMKSPTPGLVAQLAGILTTKRYKYATVFVDNFSGMGYVHLQKTQDADESLEAKVALERNLLLENVKVCHYHAD